jgi:pimeloyl-ACP methyl ester carboxylesterase
MARVRVGDLEMHYIEAGAGEPVVLVMGLGGDHLAWGFQIKALAERHRVIAFDNRGVGQTDAPDAPYTTRMMAADTLGLMDALGIDRAHVIGVSMGGMIAQELALTAPDRVRSLHLGCTMARPDGYLRALLEAWRSVRTALPLEAALRAQAVWLFAPQTYNDRRDFVELVLGTALANPNPQSVHGFLRQVGAIETHDTVDRLAAIRCPTLVTVAEEDILVPPRFSRALALGIPGAELRAFTGAGHVYFWECADDFNAVALEFIGRS